FRERGLHRIMASYMPANLRSGALLERLGFEQAGYARDYLMINGRWEDHVLTALINPAG
ncbi:GNAT family N-acetyltransferase, partial [Aeromonas caviae]|uniref:GNAT family N-acetyltransferase n=1 Tax=Aeromonas caviae TaxID=648 RepID=UPI000F544EB1